MGNSYKAKASDELAPEGVGGKVGRATDDDDVEGHAAGKAARASEDIAPEGVGGKVGRATDDDDVEGHAAGKAAR